MTEEVKKEQKENKAKDVLKSLLALDPVLLNYAPKLKPHAKVLYYVLSAIILIEAFGVGAGLGFSGFILALFNLALVRLLAEYLENK